MQGFGLEIEHSQTQQIELTQRKATRVKNQVRENSISKQSED